MRSPKDQTQIGTWMMSDEDSRWEAAAGLKFRVKQHYEGEGYQVFSTVVQAVEAPRADLEAATRRTRRRL